MRRQIKFKFQNDRYYMEEDNSVIFSIMTSDLKFDSLTFYEGVYKGKCPHIELVNSLSNDLFKKGTYIFDWLNKIISEINSAFPEDNIEENDDEESDMPTGIIPLFEFSACAGEGFFIDNDIPHTDIRDITGKADYAVKISGKSMEPTIGDNSIVYIKKADTLDSGEIGLFVVDGDVMCKRYIKLRRGYKLVPDNEEFSTYTSSKITSCRTLGKVIR